jgi:hypothetical protein
MFVIAVRHQKRCSGAAGLFTDEVLKRGLFLLYLYSFYWKENVDYASRLAEKNVQVNIN